MYLSVNFVAHECIRCDVGFALTKEYDSARRGDHKNFRCPNGHYQYYPNKSPLEKMTDARDACRNDADFWEEQSDNLDTKLKRIKRSRSAIKGHNTRLRTPA